MNESINPMIQHCQPVPINESIIAARVQARELAGTIAAMAREEAEQLPAALRGEFFAEIGRRLDIKPAAPPPAASTCAVVEPFSDAQARAWGRNRMQFGIHEGKSIDQIPISYLEKLADPSDFTRHLRRYLASQRIAVEQEMEEQRR